MDAVGAHEANDEGGDQTKGKTCVQESQWHGQDTRPQTALQQMNQSVRITGRNKYFVNFVW